MNCKVCRDAGRPESVYTSHYVKDRSGNVICPTLLNQECRYCFKKGHTVKFCQAVKKNASASVSLPPVTKKISNVAAPRPANKFTALYEEEPTMQTVEEEPTTQMVEEQKVEEQEPVVKFEEFPSLGGAAVAKRQPELCYSKALSTPKLPVKTFAKPIVASKVSGMDLNWAESDSDDDDDINW
jgi:Nanos RNA binding domain